MFLRRLLYLSLFLNSISFAAHNHQHASARDSQFQFSYTYSRGVMNELNISEDQYFSDTSFMMKPEEMIMEMHMIGIHYSINKKWSLMLMSSYQKKEMEAIMKMGRRKVSTSAQGVGDTLMKINYSLNLENKSIISFTGGLSLPTGSIQKRDNSVRLPYGMQMGSGSYGAIAGVSFTKSRGQWSSVTVLEILSFLNESSEDYTFGHQSSLDTSFSYSIHDQLIFVLGLRSSLVDPLSSNEEMISNMSSPFDPQNQHGRRSHYSLGVVANYGATVGSLSYLKPLEDDLAGIQFKTADRVMFNISFPI
jgi:hypothetical protein